MEVAEYASLTDRELKKYVNQVFETFVETHSIADVKDDIFDFYFYDGTVSETSFRTVGLRRRMQLFDFYLAAGSRYRNRVPIVVLIECLLFARLLPQINLVFYDKDIIRVYEGKNEKLLKALAAINAAE